MKTATARKYVVYVLLPTDGGKWILSASFSTLPEALTYVETMRQQVETRYEIRAAGPPD